MGISVCPGAIVDAPIEEVWELLAQPTNYDQWWDAHLERVVPEGPAVEGQHIYAWTAAFGKHFNVSMIVKNVNAAKHQIQFDVTLPLGVIEHTTLTCVSRDGEATWVQFG